MKILTNVTYFIGAVLFLCLFSFGYLKLLETIHNNNKEETILKNEFRIVCEYVGNVLVKDYTCISPDEVYTRAAQLGIKPAWEEYE